MTESFKKMTKTDLIEFVLDREKKIIDEIAFHAPDNLKQYIRERFDVNKKTKGELERIVMLQETYISGLGQTSASPGVTSERWAADKPNAANTPSPKTQIVVRLHDGTGRSVASADVSVTSDQLGGTLNVRFTHEGIIADLVEDGEVTKTFSSMYDEFVEMLR